MTVSFLLQAVFRTQYWHKEFFRFTVGSFSPLYKHCLLISSWPTLTPLMQLISWQELPCQGWYWCFCSQIIACAQAVANANVCNNSSIYTRFNARLYKHQLVSLKKCPHTACHWTRLLLFCQVRPALLKAWNTHSDTCILVSVFKLFISAIVFELTLIRQKQKKHEWLPLTSHSLFLLCCVGSTPSYVWVSSYRRGQAKNQSWEDSRDGCTMRPLVCSVFAVCFFGILNIWFVARQIDCPVKRKFLARCDH